MLRLGIVDCDTSHVVQFSMRLNHKEIDQEQWVDGANIVAAVPLPWEGAIDSVSTNPAEDGAWQTDRVVIDLLDRFFKPHPTILMENVRSTSGFPPSHFKFGRVRDSCRCGGAAITGA